MKGQLYALLCLLPLVGAGCSDDDSGGSSSPVVDQRAPDMGSADQGADQLAPDMGSSVDDRCPDARAGEHVLVLYPDRVEAYRRDMRGFKVNYVCEILALREQGVTAAVMMAEGANGEIYVAQPEEGGGAVYRYTLSGEFLGKGDVNINLTDLAGLWRGEGDGLIAWSRSNENFYQLDAEGNFQGRWTPPHAADSRVSGVVDLLVLEPDEEGRPRAMMAFEDRPPQIFAFPNSPSFPEGELATARAFSPVETEIGDKYLISGAVDGLPHGVAIYQPVISGRTPPMRQTVSVISGDPGLGDGADLFPVAQGFFVLNSGSTGDAPQLSSFNTMGIPQEQSTLHTADTPINVILTTAFPNF